MRPRKRGRSTRMSEFHGKVRQKIPGGPYYYRLSVMNGVRREFSLKTCDFEEACQNADGLYAIWDTPVNEVAVAQFNAIKGFSQQTKNLPFNNIITNQLIEWPNMTTSNKRNRLFTIIVLTAALMRVAMV